MGFISFSLGYYETELRQLEAEEQLQYSKEPLELVSTLDCKKD